MPEFPEASANLDATAFAMLCAASTTGEQLAHPAPPALFFYGYQIGEEVDPLLGGHPDLAY